MVTLELGRSSFDQIVGVFHYAIYINVQPALVWKSGVCEEFDFLLLIIRQCL